MQQYAKWFDFSMSQLNNAIMVALVTSGCRPQHDEIFEIAFYPLNTNSSNEAHHYYLKPYRSLSIYFQHVTPIAPALLESAPYFHEIAAELYQHLQGKLLIAHNARWVYSFLKNHFKQHGINYRAKTLCSLKLSTQLHGNCAELSTANTGLTGALPTVTALQHYYHTLTNQFSTAEITNAIKRCLKINSLPTHIQLEDIQAIPQTAGVYRFYGAQGALLYIGKSINLRDRILGHFAADHSSTKELRLAQQVHKIDWIETGGELSALLLEAQLIKKQQPIFNRRLRRTKTLFALKTLATGNHEYHQLKLIPLNNLAWHEFDQLYGIFRQKRQALAKLNELVKTQGLCAKFLGLEQTRGACFPYQLKQCKGACIEAITAAEYNQLLAQSLAAFKIQIWPYKGPVIIAETSPHKSQATNMQYHLVYHWCHLKTSNNLAELITTARAAPTSYHFDLDIYKILLNYLANHPHQVRPVAIQPELNLG